MFSEKDLIERSVEEMATEVRELLAGAEQLRGEHERALKEEMGLRTKSIENRQLDPEGAERMWQQAEQLREDAKESLRLSVEKRLRAAEIQHKIEIHDQIEAMDVSEDAWQRALRTEKA